MILIVLFCLVATATSQLHRNAGCTKLESAYETMCPNQSGQAVTQARQGVPGKMGPIGEKGSRGLKGERGFKGENGEPNYDRVEEIVSRRIQEVGQVHSRRISELTQSLSEAVEEIGRLKNATDVCPLRYDGKCFWVEIAKNGDMLCDNAEEVCRSRGGKAANIYSELHHHMVMGYLRMMAGPGSGITAWLGMTYNQQNNQVLLSDGTAAPFLVWYPGYPDKSYCCCMGVHVDADIGSQNQNMHNFKTAWIRHGVVCEK